MAQSPVSAFDRLVEPLPPPPGSTASACRVPLFILVTSALGIKVLCAAIEAIPWRFFEVRLLVELLCAVYGVDLVSGIYHATFDFADPGPHLRHVIVSSKEAVHQVREHDLRYRVSGAWMQLVWNFQAHHVPKQTLTRDPHENIGPVDQSRL